MSVFTVNFNIMKLIIILYFALFAFVVYKSKVAPHTTKTNHVGSEILYNIRIVKPQIKINK